MRILISRKKKEIFFFVISRNLFIYLYIFLFQNGPQWISVSKRKSLSSCFFFFFSLQCNVKCGQGLQHRNVICRDGGGYPSNACNFAVKPVSRQPCIGHGLDCADDEISRQKKGAASSGTPSG